ncbi:hypothetical protein [Thalassococcus lentus]|uniref:Calx-beta domain-containing protein n=1 Tax=Thalassococcus lentus TaxID=1210524 RepID=A0ABT4XRK6_9RHOB|nr:hypothetical protein [Thalassococcus lentus]MDA7424572.1 hypothetical protein [Thalassococcus lentus]
MSTSTNTEVLLGCQSQVRVVVIEDAGNLVIQVFATDPAVTDVDALFFNLTDDSVSADLTIYPSINVENVTGFDVATGTLNQMNNGAQIQDAYDVRIEFGTLSDTSQGDVDQAAFTLYVDGDRPLTADDIDLSNLTAVINSDSGNGMALTGGNGATGSEVTLVLASDDFDGLHSATDSDIVAYNEGWQVTNGALEANGANDGNIYFESVATTGEAQISFDARAPHTEYFENGGCYGDSLEVWVYVNESDWVLLDTFTVNADGTALVGDTTGQTITAETQTLTYEGGALEDADSVRLVLDADISASNEEIFVDNVEVTETVYEGPTETVVEENVAFEETFDSTSNVSAEHAAGVEYHTRWDMRNGELQTDGCDDGQIWFDEVDVDGPATVSFDARAPHTEYFEDGGCYGDSLDVWALVDGTTWVHLDTYVVNDDGTALVGSETGQSISAESQTISYSGGALDDASSVQLYMYSDISASNEEIYFDNVTVTETVETEVPVDGGADCGEYAVTYDDVMRAADHNDDQTTDRADQQDDMADMMV